MHVLGDGGANAATVTVLDQYGDPFPGTRVRLGSDLPGVFPGDGQAFAVDRSGSHRFSYEYAGRGAITETLSAFHGVDNLRPSSAAGTVHWAADADSDGDDRLVLTGDIRRRHIVVDESNGVPVVLEYDDNDRFNLSGDPVSLVVFQSALADELKRESPSVFLTWSGYRPGSAGRITEYDLVS